MLVTKQLTVAIVWKTTVWRKQKYYGSQWLLQHSPKYILLCSTDERN